MSELRWVGRGVSASFAVVACVRRGGGRSGLGARGSSLTASARVLGGTWRLCQHGRLNTALDDTELSALDISTKARSAGWAALLSAAEEGPGDYASAAGWGWAPEVSSVELVSEEPLPDWARKALPGS